ncbi:hypothetical protein [Streptomyces showdoensis]|uniref:hypothetical protein n=1 Tax=Streptomyces showdoensis TaxID=68268 RepID=UPI000F4F3449|nr:hypothetical protein [Streptomyces showdoensis]
MLHPPTASPSRGARPPRRPGAVALLAAALAAVLLLSGVLTARGGTDARAPRAVGPAPAGAATAPPPDAGPAGGRADTPYDTPGQHPSAQGESPSPLPTRTADPTRTAKPRHTRKATTTPTAPATTPATGGPSRRPRPGASRSTAPAGTTYDRLRVGDCFDIDRDAPGTVVHRPCDRRHDAEVVARLRLTGRYADDAAVRDAAADLCRGLLRRKAAEQPLGTRWTTFVQYPYRTSYLLGEDTAVCSLAAPSGTGRKLTAPLQ